MTAMATTFDDFLDTAWTDHGDHPQEVADRLAASLHLIAEPAHVPRFARLVTHVYGEHLGEFASGVELLRSLRALSAYDGSGELDAALVRAVATLHCAGGDRTSLAGLAREDRVAVLAGVASMHAGRAAFDEGIAAYGEALALARDGLAPGSAAIRALAIGGNSLAATLEEKPDRNPEETDAMIAAAEGALTYWRQAGTWLEEERAHYRLTRSLLAAGKPRAAAGSAQACIDVCAANDAPAFELFFGYAVLALARHADGDHAAFAASRERALEQHALVPADEHVWCEKEMTELHALA